MLKKILLAAAVLASTSAAQAVTAVYTPGSAVVPVGSDYLVDFDSPLPFGTTLSGDYIIRSGTTKNVAAAPFGDKTNYFYTSSTLGDKTATIDTALLTSVSFYWGSMDKFNSVSVLDNNGAVLLTVSGKNFLPANGNQTAAATNGTVVFNAVGDEVIGGLRFTSTGVAFEIDNVAGKLLVPGDENGVPEPATWALLVVGFGMVGVSARRRRGARGSVAA